MPSNFTGSSIMSFKQPLLYNLAFCRLPILDTINHIATELRGSSLGSQHRTKWLFLNSVTFIKTSTTIPTMILSKGTISPNSTSWNMAKWTDFWAYTCTVHSVWLYSCLVISKGQCSLYTVCTVFESYRGHRTSHKAKCWARVPRLTKTNYVLRTIP